VCGANLSTLIARCRLQNLTALKAVAADSECCLSWGKPAPVCLLWRGGSTILLAVTKSVLFYNSSSKVFLSLRLNHQMQSVGSGGSNHAN